MALTLTQGDIIGPLKAAAWERAKGELRALVALEGQYRTATGERYEAITAAVDAFILDFEGNGYEE